MRLLIEIVIAGALIYFGWNTPFSEWFNRANTTIQTHLRPKRQTGPGPMMIVAPILLRETKETWVDTSARNSSLDR
jgi:hypothetical protein